MTEVTDRLAPKKPPRRTDLLPVSSDPEEWTDAEKVRVEAAGLVFTYPDWHARAGDRTLAPRPVVEKFMHTVKLTGLDPLARQIYCIPRLGAGGIEWGIQTGIDGFRVVAERSGQYGGRRPFLWLTKDGQWVDVFVKDLHGDHPLAARAMIIRKDWPEPLVAVATWDEYAQTKSKGGLTQMWATRGPGQLAKCAEALGLRAAFPQDLSGVYTDDEMGADVRDVGELVDAAAADGDPRPRARSRVAELASAASDPSEAPVTPEGADIASAGPVAPSEAETEDAVPLGVCPMCSEDTAAAELEANGGICESCAAEVAAADAEG